jgi:hypothetical protein
VPAQTAQERNIWLLFVAFFKFPIYPVNLTRQIASNPSACSKALRSWSRTLHSASQPPPPLTATSLFESAMVTNYLTVALPCPLAFDFPYLFLNIYVIFLHFLNLESFSVGVRQEAQPLSISTPEPVRASADSSGLFHCYSTFFINYYLPGLQNNAISQFRAFRTCKQRIVE